MGRIDIRLLGRLRRRYCFVTASLPRVVPVVVRYFEVGCQAVGFDFYMIFTVIDDDCFRVATNIDNIV